MRELADEMPDWMSPALKSMVKVKVVCLIASTFVLGITFFMVVVFRYVLKSDLFAYEEWLLPTCFWIYFLGSAVGTYEDSQIRADILASLIKNERLKLLRKLAVTVIEFVITIILVYWAVLMLIDEIAYYPNWQTTIALEIPFIVPRMGIAIGLLFMAIYSGLHVWVHSRAYLGSLRGSDGMTSSVDNRRDL